MFNIYNLNTEEGKSKYAHLLTTLKFTEPHCLIDFLDIFSGGLENLICFSFYNNESESNIFMVGYLNLIVLGGAKTSYFDFITPYGYSGPCFSANVTNDDIVKFWENVDSWYKNNNIITEFIRFNLSNNYLNYSGNIYPTLLNVKGEILDEEQQWRLFDHKVRKNVNKAKRENLLSKFFYLDIDDERISEFFNIYTSTMARTDATKNFFYSFNDINGFIKNNMKHCAICTIYYENNPISTELLLISKESIYSFLGGTEDRYFSKRPNDLLKFEIINWARENKIKYYVLGGGYGSEDGIFNYKKSFFPKNIVNYYTGRKIINNDIYNNLIEKSNIVRLASGYSVLDLNDISFFPLYNKPV